MLRKRENKAITSTIALLIGWLILGIVLTYGLIEFLNYQEVSGYVVFGLIAISIGTVCFFSELIANLKMFEEAED